MDSELNDKNTGTARQLTANIKIKSITSDARLLFLETVRLDFPHLVNKIQEAIDSGKLTEQKLDDICSGKLPTLNEIEQVFKAAFDSYQSGSGAQSNDELQPLHTEPVSTGRTIKGDSSWWQSEMFYDVFDALRSNKDINSIFSSVVEIDNINSTIDGFIRKLKRISERIPGGIEVKGHPVKWRLDPLQQQASDEPSLGLAYQELILTPTNEAWSEYFRRVIVYEIEDYETKVLLPSRLHVKASCSEPNIKEVRLSFEYVIEQILKAWPTATIDPLPKSTTSGTKASVDLVIDQKSDEFILKHLGVDALDDIKKIRRIQERGKGKYREMCRIVGIDESTFRRQRQKYKDYL